MDTRVYIVDIQEHVQDNSDDDNSDVIVYCLQCTCT